MKKISLNHWFSVLFFGGLLITFTQCDKEYVTADMTSTALEMRRNGAHNQGDVDNSGDQANQDICTCLTENYALEELSTAEKNALLFMVEEEKLAKDVYDFLYEKWDYRVFDRISNAEQKHMEAIACLIDKYGLTSPVTDDAMGAFTEPILRALYGELTAAGSASMEAAFVVGATIEDLDIKDLMETMEDPEVDNEDITAVFGELTKGSRNHLRAFIKNLTNVGTTYSPVEISVELFEEIINSDREQGGSICEGLNECALNNNRAGQRNGPGAGDGTCDGTGRGGPDGNNGNGSSNGPNNGTAGNNQTNCPNGTPSGTCNGTGPNGNSGN